MNNNTETIQQAAEKYGFGNNGMPSESYQVFINGANWQKEQDEAKIVSLVAEMESWKCENFETLESANKTILEWEAKYKALLDSHNELLNGIKEINEVSNGIGVLNQNWLREFCQELINKAKNI